VGVLLGHGFLCSPEVRCPMHPLGRGVSGANPSPSGLGKNLSFRGCALRYLGSTLHMLEAGVAKRAQPASPERGSEGEEECEDDMRDRRDS
jgi:hypothetical protein